MTPNAYYQPTTVTEALDLIAEYGPSMLILAGGTLAMPLFNEGISNPEQVLSLRHAGMDKIELTDEYAILGAAVTMSQIADWDGIPMLSAAANEIGGWAVRNMATVGGNLFAPAPAGDFAAALLALSAQVKLKSSADERLLPLDEFYLGFMATALGAGELVTEIHVPWPTGKTAYIKFGRKEANTPAVVTVAAQIIETDGIVSQALIALNGVSSYPMRAIETENQLVGHKLEPKIIEQAAAQASAGAQPFTDSVATDWYRLKMAEVQTKRTLLSLIRS